jgi:2-polyprenyl-3-methyl-5-hydroxy-6-metoxy-1,4-benzoquinol methylase
MIEVEFGSQGFNPYAASAGVRDISDKETLNFVMAECDAALAVSDDELRRVFRTYRYNFDYSCTPADPWSPEYRDFQFACYEKIAGKKYSIANEFSNFLDVQKFVVTPFPFYTQSYRTVSEQLIMIGLVMSAMKLPPGAKILEFGAGWGNTAVNLARMGYKVTVVDLEQRFLDIVKGRSSGFEENLETVQGDFSVIDELPGKYDAILFKECFHHCADHQRFVASFSSRLSENGIVCFAGEPVYPEFPVPWGVQFDGESVWAIRNFGWLELGFKESYFVEMLEENKFHVEKYVTPLVERGTIFVARMS